MHMAATNAANWKRTFLPTPHTLFIDDVSPYFRNAQIGAHLFEGNHLATSLSAPSPHWAPTPLLFANSTARHVGTAASWLAISTSGRQILADFCRMVLPEAVIPCKN